MGDILHYRIPNQKSISLFGKFTKVKSILNAVGFFVSDFEKQNVFVFESNESKPSFCYSKNLIQEQSKEDYIETGEAFLSKIKTNNFSKAILSRVKLIDRTVDLFQLYEALCATYENAFVYLISSETFGTWIGATPEVLIHREKNSAKTMSLAGTLPVDTSDSWSVKELEEQAFVTTFIREQLSKLDLDGVEQGELHTVKAGPVKHLKTEFKFNVLENQVLELTSLLHPTPAVSGVPRVGAISLINELEKHDRQFYSGLIGVHNEQNSDIFVNLRCAQVFDERIALYLGGGYTQNSLVHKEWAETEAKSATLLNVIKNIEN
ncbi:MAG: chorismate-binding protein [Crocinitomicaceae bacterium]|nr:chorismate-binding protein [Crocinitomicaceae bacterium]